MPLASLISIIALSANAKTNNGARRAHEQLYKTRLAECEIQKWTDSSKRFPTGLMLKARTSQCLVLSKNRLNWLPTSWKNPTGISANVMYTGQKGKTSLIVPDSKLRVPTIRLFHKPSSRTQYTEGSTVDRKDLRKGDLVFFTSRRSGRNVGHVGIVVSADNEKALSISSRQRERGEDKRFLGILRASVYRCAESSRYDHYKGRNLLDPNQ